MTTWSLDLCKILFLRATVWSSSAVLQNKAAWIDSILSQHFWRSQNHWAMANDNDDGNANPGSHLCSIIFWQICQKPVLKFEQHENALEWMQVKGWRLSCQSIQYHSVPHAIYTAEPHMPEDGFETMILLWAPGKGAPHHWCFQPPSQPLSPFHVTEIFKISDPTAI